MSGPQTQLTLDTLAEGPPVELRVGGVLELSTVDAFVAAVTPYLTRGSDVIADLSGVRLCDSTGLGALVSLERAARANRCSFAIRGPRGYVAKVIAMTGIDRVIRVY